MSDEDNDKYLTKAKKITSEVLRLPVKEVYVVWFSKTLKNWKALVSTDLVKGVYVEVTYDGSKEQSYVDVYSKQNNIVIPDAFYEEQLL